MSIEIVKFKTKDFRLKCPIHGVVGVKPAFDPYLKKMTAISCEKCPDVLTLENAYDRRPDLNPQ